MAVNEKLTQRVRELIGKAPEVAEKRMFRGITFMVDGKMCVSVGDDRIMCRIDPELHAEAVRKPGCRTVEMGGRPYLGFVYVDERHLATKRALKPWIDMALAFNPRASASRKSSRKPAKKPSRAAGPLRKAKAGAAGRKPKPGTAKAGTGRKRRSR